MEEFSKEKSPFTDRFIQKYTIFQNYEEMCAAVPERLTYNLSLTYMNNPFTDEFIKSNTDFTTYVEFQDKAYEELDN